MRAPRLSECLTIAITCGVVGWVIFPVGSSNPRLSALAKCHENAKSLALAIISYSIDNDGKPPIPARWMDAIEPLMAMPQREHCPLIEGNGLYGYALNAGIKSTNMGPGDQRTILVYESANLARNAFDLLTSMPNPGRHDGRNTVAYMDGHVQSVVKP
jgi:prepilin-type processing-associated H-X9-DG protein